MKSSIHTVFVLGFSLASIASAASDPKLLLAYLEQSRKELTLVETEWKAEHSKPTEELPSTPETSAEAAAPESHNENISKSPGETSEIKQLTGRRAL